MLPNLDDRTYDDLRAEALALLPALCPSWTNHNPSDPGIALVELLAWLTEQLIYRTNQIPPADTRMFLKLLGAEQPVGVPDQPGIDTLTVDISSAMAHLRERYRAVTADDYESLVLHHWLDSPPGAAWLAAVEDETWTQRYQDTITLMDREHGTSWLGRANPANQVGDGILDAHAWLAGPNGGAWLRSDRGKAWLRTADGAAWLDSDLADDWRADQGEFFARSARIRRVRCVSRRDLTSSTPEEPMPAHVSVIVVPERAGPVPYRRSYPPPQPTDEAIQSISAFLRERRMLATRHHVLGPTYVDVTVTANLSLRSDAPVDAALDDACRRLVRYFDPLEGGPASTGWPFGRNVYVGDVYALLSRLDLVDYVEKVIVDGPRPLASDRSQPAGIELLAGELVRLRKITLTPSDIRGVAHPVVWPQP
jgi:hypothetical protein